MPPWKPTDDGWRWLIFGVLVVGVLAIMFGGYVFGQPGDTTPTFGHIAVQAVDTTGANRVNVGDLSNHALRVNVVSGGGTGGTSSNFAGSFPGTGTAAGFKDPNGFMASASATNNNALLVETLIPTTTNVAVRPGDSVNNAIRVNVVAGSAGGPSGNIGAAVPATAAPAGFRDSGGFLATASITNNNALYVESVFRSTGDVGVRAGDSSNNALRVNVVAGSVGGSGSIGAAFPSTVTPIGVRDASGFIASASNTNNNALFVESIFPTTTNVGVRAGDSSNNALRVNIVTGTVAITGAAPSTFGAAFPANGMPVGGSDGTNFITFRVKTSTPGSSDPGVVTRPLMPTDGTNTMPVGDTINRPIYVSVANGSTVTTDNNALELGATTVAQTNSMTYGSVIRNPSTMTLANNAMGARATFGRAGQQIVQQNAPVGDWITGFASMTTTANTQVVAAQVSGVGFCMTDYMIGNLSSTDTYVVFRSGQTDITGYIPVPALGGNNKTLTTPICTASASALNLKAHIAVATVTVTVNGYKTKDF